MSQLDIVCHQVKLLVPGMGYIRVNGQRGLVETPEQLRP